MRKNEKVTEKDFDESVKAVLATDKVLARLFISVFNKEEKCQSKK